MTTKIWTKPSVEVTLIRSAQHEHTTPGTDNAGTFFGPNHTS